METVTTMKEKNSSNTAAAAAAAAADGSDVVNLRFSNMTPATEQLFSSIISEVAAQEGNNTPSSVRLVTTTTTTMADHHPQPAGDVRRSSVLKLRPASMSPEISEKIYESFMQLDELEHHREDEYEASYEMHEAVEIEFQDDDAVHNEPGVEDNDAAAGIATETPLTKSRKSLVTSLSASMTQHLAEGIADVELSDDPQETTTAGAVLDKPNTEAENVVQEGPYKPLAGSTSIQITNPTDPALDAQGKVHAGWRTVDPSSIQVRGAGYSMKKTKIQNPQALYDCLNVDVVESQHRYPDIARQVRLPTITFPEEKDPTHTKTWTAPDLFVITVALPTSQPSMWGGSEEAYQDGPGYTFVMYYAMKQQTRDILKRVTAVGYDPTQDPKTTTGADGGEGCHLTNAVRLFDTWCQKAPTEQEWFARFKVIPQAVNLKEMGLPSWISKFNGLPFLIKRPGESGLVFSHPERSCMEFDISLHPFPYLAKKGICYMKEAYFEKTVVTFAFCIEGRTETELPECLIGLFQLCYPNPIHAIQGEDWFAGK